MSENFAPTQRKKPFSHKQKKKQLQEKRLRNQIKFNDPSVETVQGRVRPLKLPDGDGSRTTSIRTRAVQPAAALIPRNSQSSSSRTKDHDPNRLRTVFDLDDERDLQRRKADSYRPIERHKEAWTAERPSEEVIDIPQRPSWNYSMSPAELERSERTAFKAWLRGIYAKYPPERLNHFEHNLEVWRQLWRVSEKSDVLVPVVDARYPLFHFAPALYRYVVNDLGKPLVLVLNKTDLVPQRVLDAWLNYFNIHYPSLRVVCFTSHPNDDGATATLENHDVAQKRRRMKRRAGYRPSVGMDALLRACGAPLVDSDAHGHMESTTGFLPRTEESRRRTTGPTQRVAGECEHDADGSETDTDAEGDECASGEGSDADAAFDSCAATSDSHPDLDDLEGREAEEEERRDVFTIGMVGHPNVGKSSLINGLMGRKVVSTSRTPGHTKHFQTIMLTSSVRLCDCPGLVFPALDQSRAQQVLCGVFPIAQVREPYGAIRLLAERCPLERIYRLPPPEDDAPWSPFLICDAYARLKGYFTARGARPDAYRAANEILRDCLDGRVVVSFLPPPAVDPPPKPSCAAAPTSLLKQAPPGIAADEPNESRTRSDQDSGRPAARAKSTKPRNVFEMLAPDDDDDEVQDNSEDDLQ